jgi:hypothetical protein
MTICCSLLIGRAIIKYVFGELRPLESQVKYRTVKERGDNNG